MNLLNRPNRKLFRVLLCILLAFIFPASTLHLQSQSLLTITDTLVLKNGYVGESKYSILDPKDFNTVHGPFLFKAQLPSSIDSQWLKQVIYQGRYNKGLKEGKWEFEHKHMKPWGLPYLEGVQVVYNAEGEKHKVTGSYLKGVASQKWEVLTERIVPQKPVDTVFYSTVHFADRLPVGPFQSLCDSFSISGNLNDSGFMDGLWVFKQKTGANSFIEEQRYYEGGILTQHVFVADNKRFNVKHVGLDMNPDSGPESWTEIPVSETYFTLFYETNAGSESDDGPNKVKTDSLIKNSNAFLKNSLFSFSQIYDRNIWDITTQVQTPELPKVKVKKTRQSEAYLSKISESLKKLTQNQKVLNGFVTNPQVDISRYNNREIANYYYAFQVLLNQTEIIERVLLKLQQPVYAYLNSEELLQFLLKEGIVYPNELVYEFEGEQIRETFEFPQPLESSKVTFQSFFDHIQDLAKVIQGNYKQIEPVLQRIIKRSSIAGKEDELLQKRDSIVKLFDNAALRKNFNAYHQDLALDVQYFVNEAFKTYAQKDIEERLGTTGDMISCFDTVLLLYEHLAQLPNKIASVDDLFTREVWSPVTYTYMTEIMKERVYRAYKSYLLPFVIQEIRENLNCTNLYSKSMNIVKLHNGMYELRDRDTGKEERELRRVTNPQRILEILNINLD